MDIILFGIQGSGKGTLGALVAEKYGFSIFETGGALRNLAALDTELGKKVKHLLEEGIMVTNDIVMEIIENFMQNLPENRRIIFDGMPRFMEQAKTFADLMKKNNREYIGILIDVPREAALNRLVSRRICKDCKSVFPSSFEGNVCSKCGGDLIVRSDDNEDIIKTRIETFYQETVPVIDLFRKNENLITMDGNRSIEDCKVDIFKIIEEKLNIKA